MQGKLKLQRGDRLYCVLCNQEIIGTATLIQTSEGDGIVAPVCSECAKKVGE